jgi:hypothetical protein
MRDNIHSLLPCALTNTDTMADPSAASFTLDQSQQADADASPASVDIHSLLNQSSEDTDIMESPIEAELAHDQNKRAGKETTAMPVGSAKAQTYEAPAVAAVLQTNELLHLIISELPREYRTSIRRISKAWRGAVEKIGHAFEPEGHAVCERPCYCASSPLYASHIAFRIHPALYSTGVGHGGIHITTCVGASQTNHHRVMVLGQIRAESGLWKGIERLAENKHEFITSPPVTEVITCGALRYPTIVQASRGVRFGHLIERLLAVTHVGSMQAASAMFSTQLPNVESKSELRDSSSEEEESDENGESDEVDDSDQGETSEDEVESSSESEGGREAGDNKSAGEDRTKGSSAAMDAVMQTNELLHLIIAEVPLKYRTSIRRVSKTWQAAVAKIGYTLQPVAYDQHDHPVYSASKLLVTNKHNNLIFCGSAHNPRTDPLTRLSFYVSGATNEEGDHEFLTDPPVTHVKLSSGHIPKTTTAILRVREGITIRDVKECFARMSSTRLHIRMASIAIQRQEDDESNASVGTVSSSEEDDPSEPENESDADDSDESDSGAGGAGMPDFGEPGDSDDSGASSDSDDSSEDDDSNSGEREQVEDSSAAAVLELPELLHMIISEVPREHRTMLRSVSRDWKAAVEKIGYVFQPDDIGHGLYREDDPMPLYTSQAIFRSNPVFLDSLFSKRRPADQVNPGYLVKYRCLGSSRSIPHFVSVAKLSENGHQFVTHPPLTEMLVRTGSIAHPRVRLQVDGGIRLRDLLEFFQTVHRGGEGGLFQGYFGGPKEFSPSKHDEESGEGSLDESGDGSGGPGSAGSSAPDEPVDESEGVNFDASEGGAEGDEPVKSSAPDGNCEKTDGEARAEEQVGASSRVMHTNELLHMIISEVPREFRISMRRVSKNWQAAVVKLGYTVEPEKKKSRHWSRHYLSQTEIKVNPVFIRTANSFMPVPMHGHHGILKYTPGVGLELTGREREFITSPPITEVLLFPLNCNNPETLRVRGGIRVEDLVASANDVGARFLAKLYWDGGYAVIATFAVELEGTRRTNEFSLEAPCIPND